MSRAELILLAAGLLSLLPGHGALSSLAIVALLALWLWLRPVKAESIVVLPALVLLLALPLLPVH